MPHARLSRATLASSWSGVTFVSLSLGVLGASWLLGCGQDACEEFESQRIECESYDPSTDQGGYTGAACTEEARVQLECLLNEGIDTCMVFYHPEQLSEEDVQKVIACQGS